MPTVYCHYVNRPGCWETFVYARGSCTCGARWPVQLSFDFGR